MRKLGWLAVVALVLGWQAPALAAIQTIEVMVDVTGNTPEDARAKALEYVKKRAFYLMLSKTNPEQADEIVKTMTTEQIYQHIRGAQVMQELQNGNQYIARYSVSVSEDMMARLKATDDAGASKANPTLVIPVLRTAEHQLLWEPSNIWRSLWNTTALEQGEGILVVPYGDPTDMQITDSATILSYNFEPLKAMAERYGAGEIVVVLAEYETAQEPHGVSVTMRRLAPNFDKMKDMFFEVNEQFETPESLLAEAARVVALQIKDIAKNYQGEEERRIADATKQAISVPFTRMNEWVRIQQIIKELPRVVRFDVNTISINHASGLLMYDGTPELMLQVMEAKGLRVEPTGDSWQLTLMTR